jgi:hypothetical protein
MTLSINGANLYHFLKKAIFFQIFTAFIVSLPQKGG